MGFGIDAPGVFHPLSTDSMNLESFNNIPSSVRPESVHSIQDSLNLKTEFPYVEKFEGFPANTEEPLTPPDAQSAEPQPTLAQWMQDHPDGSYEDAMQYMAQHSEEWAEKYLDYLTEKGELDRANEYTANREDTAYQRLVADLKNAGLNPAMMFGGTGSISAAGSQGYVKMTEGANSRSVGNYSKIQKILLAYMSYTLARELGYANTAIKAVGTLLGGISGIAGLVA